MNKITEEDIVKAYMPLVMRECKNFYKGLEPEDRFVEGQLALIYAIRTYKKRYGCFESYLQLQLKAVMKQKNKEAWAIKRLEARLTLDAPLDDSKGKSQTLSHYIGVLQDDTALDVKDFIENLPPIEKQLVLLLMNNYTITKISGKFGLTVPQVHSLLKRVQKKAVAYYDTASF